MRDLGARLREERRRLGLIQPQLADYGEVAVQAQSLYESGKRIPRADYLANIARAGVDVRFVLTGQRNGAAIVPPHAAEMVVPFDREDLGFELVPPATDDESRLIAAIRDLEREDQAAIQRLALSLQQKTTT